MFRYFELEIVEEIRLAKSRISVSFDGWGSKREKLSVVGVVVHFINAKYENVTRLIGLPELPNYSKVGTGKYLYILTIKLTFSNSLFCRSSRGYTSTSRTLRHHFHQFGLLCSRQRSKQRYHIS